MAATVSSSLLSSGCEYPHCLYINLYNFSASSPYYIWLGRPRSCDVSRFCHAFEIEGGNIIGNCSPQPLVAVKEIEMVPPLQIGEPVVELSTERAVVIDITSPLSSFHYQVKNVCLHQFYRDFWGNFNSVAALASALLRTACAQRI